MLAIDKRYCAGFFDADGSVGVYFFKDKKSSRGGHHLLKANIGQRFRLPLFDELLVAYGGNLNYDAPGRAWHWQVAAQKALPFLRDIEPFLRNKRRQAQLAIEFQERMTRGGGLSDEEFAYRVGISTELKRLKRMSEEEQDAEYQ